ncbi:MAG: hypothetical protein CM1200mP2_40390 [Planctomycetaceae bacterium]|nr:MAG: hypothetical protein CM1200mP2_40390 [Planctomycetaceae bacterium]
MSWNSRWGAVALPAGLWRKINPIGGIGYEVEDATPPPSGEQSSVVKSSKWRPKFPGHVHRGEQRPIGPLEKYPVVAMGAGDRRLLHLSRCGEETETLQFGALPTREEAVAIHEKWSNKLAEDRARGAHDWE